MTPAVVGVLAGYAVLVVVVAMGTRTEPSVEALYVPAGRRRRRTGGTIRERVAAMGLLRRIARVDRIAASIQAAGRTLDIGDVLLVKCAGAVGVLGVTVMVLGPGMLPIGLLAAAGAFVLPDLVLTRAAKRRRRAADEEVTQFIDLLAAASSAGLSAPAAIRRASTGVRGPLGDALAASSAAVDVGGRWREELGRVAEHFQLPDLRATVVVIVRTETLGASLADALQELAQDVRGSRRARAAERARTAPVKMLFPLVFMVLPAFLLLTVVPVLIATVRSLS